MDSLYYHPESHDAELIGAVDSGSGYDFNMIAVFRCNRSGKLYWGTDSGCSCFSPFSCALSSLQEIYHPGDFSRYARSWASDQYESARLFDPVNSLCQDVLAAWKESKNA